MDVVTNPIMEITTMTVLSNITTKSQINEVSQLIDVSNNIKMRPIE